MSAKGQQVEGQLSLFDFLSPAQEYFFETGKTTHWQDSQGKPHQWWKKEDPICQHSGHTCNKKELWKVATALDNIYCPHKCCRECYEFNCGARCNGAEGKRWPVDIKGICDDPYCPRCGYSFWDYGSHIEVDCDSCPECGLLVSWEPWHRKNDEEAEDGSNKRL